MLVRLNTTVKTVKAMASQSVKNTHSINVIMYWWRNEVKNGVIETSTIGHYIALRILFFVNKLCGSQVQYHKVLWMINFIYSDLSVVMHIFPTFKILKDQGKHCFIEVFHIEVCLGKIVWPRKFE